jgi:formate hydrogenlyase transcriptional activator
MQKRNKSIPKPAMDSLTSGQWLGNVRELENFIERAVILTQRDELNVCLAELKKSSVRNTLPVSTFQEAERQAIIEALKAASGRISGRAAAAERLGLKRATLQKKCADSTLRKPITADTLRAL